MIVGISAGAEADIADGYWFYERQMIGLGDYVANESGDSANHRQAPIGQCRNCRTRQTRIGRCVY